MAKERGAGDGDAAHDVRVATRMRASGWSISKTAAAASDGMRNEQRRPRRRLQRWRGHRVRSELRLELRVRFEPRQFERGLRVFELQFGFELRWFELGLGL